MKMVSLAQGLRLHGRHNWWARYCSSRERVRTLSKAHWE